MSNFQVVNILDMIETIGEDEVNSILSEFSCTRNPEIENFVKKNAVILQRKRCQLHI